ncbi:MAG: ABC transporter substrate-binding protein [Candidatus Rifleibacteriota bacterium]
MRNFLIGVFIVWLIIVGLIIKHENATTGKEGDNSHSERVTIVFWHAMGGPLGRVMTDLIDRYNNSQQDYYIKAVSMGSYDTLAKKVLASLVAGEAPDISQNYETLTKKFIKHDKIVCLDRLIASESEDIKADIIPVLLRNNTFNGKLYSFPFNKSVPVLYYNKDMFEEVGLDPDKPPKTLDDLAEYAETITRYYKSRPGPDLGIYGYGCSKSNVWNYLNRVLQFGGKIVSEDAKKSFFDQEPAINALLALQTMLFKEVAREGQGFDHQNDFIAGKCAIIESSIVSKVFMENSIDFDFAVAPLPEQVEKGVILSGSNINIFDNGDPAKIAGAWDFIKWFTSTEIGAEWSVRTTYIPVRKSSLKSDYFLEAQKRDPNLKAPYVQLEYSKFEPRLTSWFEIRDLMADHLERASIEVKEMQKEYKEKHDKDNLIDLPKSEASTFIKKYIEYRCKEMAEDVNAILKHSSR